MANAGIAQAARLSFTALVLALAAAADATAGDPPVGPPWRMQYEAARREAIRAGRPVFVYFTKTY